MTLMQVKMSEIDPNLLQDMDGETAGWELYEQVRDDLINQDQIVWHPEFKRAGYVLTGSGSSGTTTWTDAKDLEDAVRRFEDDDIKN